MINIYKRISCLVLLVTCSIISWAQPSITTVVPSPAYNTFTTNGDRWGIYSTADVPTETEIFDNGSGTDNLGPAPNDYSDGDFFVMSDIENPENVPGTATIVWTVDIASAGDLTSISVDMIAMGDFEASDLIDWNWQIDAGPTTTFFDIDVNDAIAHNYTMPNGLNNVLINDPFEATIDGMPGTTVLEAGFKTLTYNFPPSTNGTTLTITMFAQQNADGELYGFDNLVITSANGVATDNLTTTTSNCGISDANNVGADEDTLACTGSSTDIIVVNSDTGAWYVLRNEVNDTLIGSPMKGNGGNLNLPTGPVNVDMTYNVYATDSSSCMVELLSKASVVIGSAGGYTMNPVNDSVCPGDNAWFKIDGTGAIDSLKWQVSTDGGLVYNNLMNGGAYFISAFGDSLAISPVSGSMSNNYYRSVAYACGTKVDSTNHAELIVDIPPDGDAGFNDTICSANDTADVEIQGFVTGYGIYWSGGAGSYLPDSTSTDFQYVPSAAEKTAGSAKLYLNVIPDYGICPEMRDSMLVIISTTPIVDAGSSQSICFPNTVNLSGSTNASSYWWSTDGAGMFDDSTSLTATYTPGSADTISSTINMTLNTLNGGCTDINDVVVITVSSCTGVDGSATAQVSVSPNPSSGLFNVSVTEPATLTVINAVGSVVTSSEVSGSSVIDLSGEADGAYILHVESNGGSATIRLVKE